MELTKLFKDCIENFNLDVSKLRDIAFSICIADKLHGTNSRELDIDKFVESDSELDWNSILGLLGIEPQSRGCDSLPRVQKLRVLSDTLSMSVCDKVSDLTLMCGVSREVAKHLGVSLPRTDYADETECYANLGKISSYLSANSLNLGNLEVVYKKLCFYDSKVKAIGKTSIGLIDTSEILIPDKIYSNLGKCCTSEELNSFLSVKGFSADDYTSYIVDKYCYSLVQVVAKAFNKVFIKNEVEFNLILTRLNSYAPDYLPIGTYSLNGYTERLSVLRNVPSYLSRKVNIVFSENATFNEETILGCISILLFLGKMNIKKADFTCKMEGLLNECKDIG